MHHRVLPHRVLTSFAFGLALLASACGGGQTSLAGPGGPVGAGQGVAVTVSPSTASVAASGLQAFAAAVTGTASTAVTWSLQEGAAAGTISAAGLYSAPAAAGTFHIVATSVADPTKSGSAQAVVSVPVPVDPNAILPADRATTWNPGMLPLGGIPARTTVCKSLSASGADDTSAIQAAIDACPAGQVVQLAAGTFTVNSPNFLLLSKGITLRGAGPGATILQKTNGAKPNTEATGATPTPIAIVGPSRWPSDGGNVSTNLTADGVKGAFSVTVASAAGFAAGQFVLLDELSGATWQTDPGGRGKILASSDWRVTYQLHSPGQGTDDPIAFNATTGLIGNGSDAASWFSRQDRVTAEMKKVASVSGNTITFTTPLHIGYRASHTAQVTRFGQDPHVTGAGIEDLSVIGGDNGNIRFERAANCWVRNVEGSVWHDEGFAVNQSFGIEVRRAYIHDAAWAQPGGAGYAISLSNGSAEILVEDSIIVRANKVMVARCSGAGSVFGYNYADEGYINTNGAWIEIGLNASHMVGPHHVLFEGNYSFNADSDKTHGSSIYHTYFRNHLRGIRAAFTNPHDGTSIDDATQSGNGPKRCVGAGFYSYWMSYVGNVLGASGQMSGWIAETTFGGGQPGIWMLGWDDWAPYPTDPQVKATAFRHGNFDYLSNAVAWDAGTTNHTLPSSLYLTQKPAFFAAGSGYTWPWVDPTGAPQLHTLPAKARFDAGTPFTQP